MANYINKYTNIQAYNADNGKQYPNVSYLVDEDIIKWEKNDPVHIVCKYNVTSTSEATKLLFDENYNIIYQIIDGVRQDTVQATYTFDTLGEHTVKYKLNSYNINCSFSRCTSLTSMIIPNDFLQINRAYFCNRCTSLTNVKLSDKLDYIQDSSFYGCSSLTDITIPSGVTYIGGSAFESCSGLTSITIKATTPPTLMSDAFSSTNNCPIYVPAESLEAYRQATNWSRLADRISAIVA